MSWGNNSAIEAVKSRLAISELVRRYVELRPVGSRLVAPCPFHQETKPSFSVNDELGTFYCFGCQASGDIFDFYSRINGLDFRETLEQLAEETGVKLERHSQERPGASPTSLKKEMLRLHQLAAAHFSANLHAQAGEVCRAYLDQRGLSQEIISAFDLGWSLPDWQALREALRRAGGLEQAAVQGGLLASSDAGRVYDRFRQRLIFPIKNLTGQVVAFGGRVLPQLAQEDDAKYINSSDTPIYKKGEHLYGLYQARRSISVHKNILLTEGYMDVLTLHQFGYTQAVGVLGTAFTPEQAKRIGGLTSQVELVFDGDRAGRKAALRVSEMLLARGVAVRVIDLPDGEDIDSLLRNQGREAFEALRQQAGDGLVFCVECLQADSPREAVEWARTFLAQVQVPELFSRYATILATTLSLSEDVLRNLVVDRKKAVEATIEIVNDPLSYTLDKQIIILATRYPHRLAEMRAKGMDIYLTAPWAKKYWNKLETYGPGEVFQYLTEKEKQLWITSRQNLPVASELEQEELRLNMESITKLQVTAHKTSVGAALRTATADYQTGLEYMRALQRAKEAK